MSSRSRRLFGVRLYLALALAAVALITAAFAYLLVSDRGEEAADEELTEVAVGRTVRLADELGDLRSRESTAAVSGVSEEGYAAWAFDRDGRLISDEVTGNEVLDDVPRQRRAVRSSLDGARYTQVLSGGGAIVSAPIFRDGEITGAVLARSGRPPGIEQALDEVRSDLVAALGIAVVIAILLSFLIAYLITSRVKRLADSAALLSEGNLDQPLEGTGGHDEIADLGRSLETMREALRGTFGALRSERDRLSAIFDALGDAVMVVRPSDGGVRFSNAAATELITEEGTAIAPLMPWLRRAAHRGKAERDTLRVGERVYSLNVRELPAEGAVLAVVRDRTEELRRELAEREFVSNAAHELRNPIAGISGAIEVLRSGAKDDPDALEHFLARLADDAERIARLTESLLTLARMESVGEGGTEALDVGIVVEETAEAVSPPEGVEVRTELDGELLAQGDRVLLRQVLIGLLTNAFKNTPDPGTVSIRARRGDGEVVIEVTDTGTGIAAEEVDRIFDRFYRGSGSLEQEGFGLGLSIARRMVDVMGGEIGVDSEPGVGSTFWVRLPAAKPAPTPVA